MISIEFDDSAVMAGLDRLGEAAKKAVRPAAQAGAQVFYEEVKRLAPQSPPGTAHIFTSRSRGKSKSGARAKYLYYSGDLKRSIYQAFSKENSGESFATYHISWAKNEGRSGRAVPYGYMVEYGTARTPAQPFLRPAFYTKKKDALEEAKRVFFETIRKGGTR